MSDLNAEIKAAIDSFDMDRARELLRDALKEADAETYYLASKAAIDNEQKQEFLEKAVEADPFHEKARKALNLSKPEPSKDKSVVETNAQPTDVPSEKEAEEKLILPTATVQSSGIVYTIPHSKGTQRTTLRKGAEVEVIGRDSKSNWANVTYINSVGQRAFGWMPVEDIGSLNYVENAASLSDLAISQLEFNSKTEIEELRNKQINEPFITGISGALVFVFSTAFFDSEAAILGILLLIFSFAALYQAFWRLKSKPANGFKDNEMKSARKAKMSTTELQMEHQQQMLLGQIAGNMATRMVPNKQDVTVRYR